MPCPHGRQHNRCKECGGSGICEHGRQRRQCKDCGGSSICEHGRRRNTCKECGGSSICVHGRRRYECKECGEQAQAEKLVLQQAQAEAVVRAAVEICEQAQLGAAAGAS